MSKFEKVSFRKACRTFQFSTSSYRYHPKKKDGDQEVHEALVSIAEKRQLGVFGKCITSFDWMVLS
jgi:hypothetical protein